MEEPVIHGGALDEPHGAGVRVRQNGLRAVGRSRDGAQALADLAESVVPANRCEMMPRPLGPLLRSGWVRRSVAVVGPLDVPVDFGTEKAARERVFGVSSNAGGAAVLRR